jgi:hypothetical protein
MNHPKAELIFKYRHTIERLCKIKIKYFAINDEWYEVIK